MFVLLTYKIRRAKTAVQATHGADGVREAVCGAELTC